MIPAFTPQLHCAYPRRDDQSELTLVAGYINECEYGTLQQLTETNPFVIYYASVSLMLNISTHSLV